MWPNCRAFVALEPRAGAIGAKRLPHSHSIKVCSWITSAGCPASHRPFPPKRAFSQWACPLRPQGGTARFESSVRLWPTAGTAGPAWRQSRDRRETALPCGASDQGNLLQTAAFLFRNGTLGLCSRARFCACPQEVRPALYWCFPDFFW